MNNKFDELTKQMAQSVTRRAALKKFGVGLAGMALACLAWRITRKRTSHSHLPRHARRMPTAVPAKSVATEHVFREFPTGVIPQ